jgi:ribose transport system permease protein
MRVTMKIVKKARLILLFPMLMFLVILLITLNNPKCFVNGNFIFLGKDLLVQVAVNSCQTICVALAIWIQLKNRRFDFSSGATMILAAIVAGNIGMQTGSPIAVFVVAIVAALVLCLITAGIYIIGRVPIIICTIGMTLFYESMTYLVFNGEGVRGFFSNAKLAIFERVPGVFIPALLAIVVFFIYSNLTTAGRKGKILANNQQAGVNIGINEQKNVFASYLATGIIIGLAAIIYISQNDVPPQSGLVTSGILFSYIVPVFMGTFIGLASNDVIGIAIAAIGMEIMNYGLNCLNLGSGGWQQIIFGVFVLGFYAFSTQSFKIANYIQRLKSKKKA